MGPSDKYRPTVKKVRRPWNDKLQLTKDPLGSSGGRCALSQITGTKLWLQAQAQAQAQAP
ncbi:hypothetical protein ACHAP7_004925 [Fusarium lateritium]